MTMAPSRKLGRFGLAALSAAVGLTCSVTLLAQGSFSRPGPVGLECVGCTDYPEVMSRGGWDAWTGHSEPLWFGDETRCVRLHTPHPAAAFSNLSPSLSLSHPLSLQSSHSPNACLNPAFLFFAGRYDTPLRISSQRIQNTCGHTRMNQPRRPKDPTWYGVPRERLHRTYDVVPSKPHSGLFRDLLGGSERLPDSESEGTTLRPYSIVYRRVY